MGKNKSIFKHFNLFVSSIFLFVLLNNITLNATTIVYYEYDVIENVTYEITEVNGAIVDKVVVDDTSFE